VKEKFIAVYRFNNSVEVLKFSLVTGAISIISADEVEKSKISVGFFESENNQSGTDLVALVATPDGPLLIMNSVQYSPKMGITKIRITDAGDFSHFSVLDKGVNIFGLFYKEKAGIGSHPYNEVREDVDFYCWLSKHIGNPKLYEHYNKSFLYLD
jgi:hypothetical protein